LFFLDNLNFNFLVLIALFCIHFLLILAHLKFLLLHFSILNLLYLKLSLEVQLGLYTSCSITQNLVINIMSNKAVMHCSHRLRSSLLHELISLILNPKRSHLMKLPIIGKGCLRKRHSYILLLMI
jgi:hypothetical protein